MVEGMKSVSEQNAKMTQEMKELAMKNAEATQRMKELAELSSEATMRMAELAEVNRQQGARQAQSIAVLAYDTKRDSEVMKAVTLVTLILLPATFVAVGPIPRQELPLTQFLSCRQSLAWDF
jgi:Mg2+ and Co2+ transporter CorA